MRSAPGRCALSDTALSRTSITTAPAAISAWASKALISRTSGGLACRELRAPSAMAEPRSRNETIWRGCSNVAFTGCLLSVQASPSRICNALEKITPLAYFRIGSHEEAHRTRAEAEEGRAPCDAHCLRLSDRAAGRRSGRRADPGRRLARHGGAGV